MDREKFKIDINTPDPGYEPFPVSIMNRSTYEATTFDPALGKPAAISYRLNKAGCIRIRIVHRNRADMLIRTLQDWTRQEFGKYSILWDGRDSSGNIVDNRQILVLFESKDKDNGLRHRDHEESGCRDPMLSVRTDPAPDRPLKGTLDIWTSLAAESVDFGRENGFEARYYMDGKLFRTDKADPGTKEFHIRLDLSELENGEHLITVNIDDLSDHTGSAGVRITVCN
ncbi:MAG: hypothetical protein HY896_05310 [Deltaproteobacteria bacterium]|nr:hypothetical protein [Deltaproteobacteria bacterium]